MQSHTTQCFHVANLRCLTNWLAKFTLHFNGCVGGSLVPAVRSGRVVKGLKHHETYWRNLHGCLTSSLEDVWDGPSSCDEMKESTSDVSCAEPSVHQPETDSRMFNWLNCSVCSALGPWPVPTFIKSGCWISTFQAEAHQTSRATSAEERLTLASMLTTVALLMIYCSTWYLSLNNNFMNFLVISIMERRTMSCDWCRAAGVFFYSVHWVSVFLCCIMFPVCTSLICESVNLIYLFVF